MTSTFNVGATHTRFRDLNEMRAFAGKLIASWDRDRGRTFRLRESERTIGVVIWSYTKHVVELMRTVLDLSRSDRMVVAIPQIRLMTELTMTGVWLHLYPEKVRAIIHESLRQKRASIKDIIALGRDGFDDALLQTIEAQVDEFSDDADPAGKHFEARCREVADGLGVYATWRVMSSLSHPGLAMADFYLREADDEGVHPAGLTFQPDAKLNSHEAWLGTAICMLICALRACDLVDADGRRKTQIARAARRMGITAEFRRADESQS